MKSKEDYLKNWGFENSFKKYSVSLELDHWSGQKGFTALFQTSQEIEKFSKFSPSDYESRFVARTLQQVESEIIAYESSGFESQNFDSSLELPSSDSSDDWSSDSDVDSDDSTDSDDFAWFTERPISPPKAIFGGSDSFVEDPYFDGHGYGKRKTAPQKTYFTNDDWSALKIQAREGTRESRGVI